MSTTPEPADHRDVRPQTERPLTKAGHPASTWTALGTMGGPIASSHRAQPANLLRQDGFDALLVDSGDGAADQLAKAGVGLAAVGASS